MTTASAVCATLYQVMSQEGVQKKILKEITKAQAVDKVVEGIELVQEGNLVED